MYFYTQTRLGILRINISHTTVAEISFGMSYLKNILSRSFELVYYLQAIHFVKLAKIVRHHNKTP